MELDTRAYRAVLARTAGALPRTTSASSDARARVAWTKALDALADAGEREAQGAEVRLWSQGARAAPRSREAIVGEVANAIAKALRRPLYRHARTVGIARVGRARVNHAWVEASRACARAWVLSQADACAWATAYHALLERLRWSATRTLPAERLALMARLGGPVRARIARTPRGSSRKPRDGWTRERSRPRARSGCGPTSIGGARASGSPRSRARGARRGRSRTGSGPTTRRLGA